MKISNKGYLGLGLRYEFLCEITKLQNITENICNFQEFT